MIPETLTAIVPLICLISIVAVVVFIVALCKSAGRLQNIIDNIRDRLNKDYEIQDTDSPSE